MANEQLRTTMRAVGVTTLDLATLTQKDPKTAARWITDGRIPHASTRLLIAERLGVDEADLWPELAARPASSAGNEIITTYPHRGAIPPSLWDRLITGACERIDVLTYVAMFLTERPRLVEELRELAGLGVRIRFLLGDRDAPAVRQRSLDEGIGEHTISAKIDHAVAFYRPLAEVSGIEFRAHGTVLYNSLYRADDEMVANPHVYGRVAPHAPALLLRRRGPGGLFDTYAASFEAVWEGAVPVQWTRAET